MADQSGLKGVLTTKWERGVLHVATTTAGGRPGVDGGFGGRGYGFLRHLHHCFLLDVHHWTWVTLTVHSQWQPSLQNEQSTCSHPLLSPELYYGFTPSLAADCKTNRVHVAIPYWVQNFTMGLPLHWQQTLQNKQSTCSHPLLSPKHYEGFTLSLAADCKMNSSK